MIDLPVNLDDLIHARAVEQNRVEFKATWNDPIAEATIHTVCAFANDLLNLNGGYIVLGIEVGDEGTPILPPRGLGQMSLDRIQKEIRGQCARIQPEYYPLLSPAEIDGRPILVIWAPAGDNRPYQAPAARRGNERAYYVRQGSESVLAKGDVLRQLMEHAAKIPFDDRRNQSRSVQDLSPSLVRRFLADVRSDLVLGGTSFEDGELYRKLRIVAPVNAHEVPRNVGLLFFHEDPDEVFPGARIEVVQFADDAGGNLVEERKVKGPLPRQIHSALDWLNSLGDVVLRKVADRAEVTRTVAYPYHAMEEAIVNALYHRSYDGVVEPTKIYLYPDRMEIISYPGPVPGVRREDFAPGRIAPPVPARNRRIGELLKELRLAEGRGTGLPKIHRSMKDNGSPTPQFDFDDERTYFRVILPVHPGYRVLHALRESAHLWATGEQNDALAHLRRAFEQQPGSGALAGQMIDYAMELDDLGVARDVLEQFHAAPHKSEPLRPYIRMTMRLLDRGLDAEARELLNRSAPMELGAPASEAADLAILRKRAGDLREAHRLFRQAFDNSKHDARFVHEYAQTKARLAGQTHSGVERKRLNEEAETLLRRVLQLTTQPARLSWCWFDLAQVMSWLKAPVADIEAAFQNAIELAPAEDRFKAGYAQWKKREASRRRHGGRR